MDAFLSTHHSAVLTFFVGLSTFGAAVGLGIGALRGLRQELPDTFLEVVGALAGIQIYSLSVQVLAMAGMATRTLLIADWLTLTLLGLSLLVYEYLRQQHDASQSHPAVVRKLGWPARLVLVLALGTNLMVALAPSTKIDELYYHMLLPARIVADGALHFYRTPYESAILPHMSFQIAAAPFHALHVADAGNVVSWCFSATLIWLGLALLAREGTLQDPKVYWVLAIGAGLYPVVFHVTSASSAYGDLALAAAILALGGTGSVSSIKSPTSLALMISITAGAATASKMSLLPLSLALLFWAAVQVRRHPLAELMTWIALGAPFIVILTPLALWTFFKSGSPLGPVVAGRFFWGRSIYDQQLVAQALEGMKLAMRPPFGRVLGQTLINYSPLVLLGAILAPFCPAMPRDKKSWIAGLLLGQLLFIRIFLAYDARFLGGLQYGCLILFLLYCGRYLSSAGGLRKFVALCMAACLLPWLGAQMYYASQFIPVVVGFETPSHFLGRYVACFDDLEALDKMLPGNAALLVDGFRPPALYSPRPMFFDPDDLPPKAPVYLLRSDISGELPLPRNYNLGEEIYFNPMARIYTFRTPGRRAELSTLHVFRLIYYH